jgi:CRISPR-associated exonuclease Cas4
LEQYSSEESITISDVIEYLFCPRFTYFIHCLSIPQHEAQLVKVRKGRALHETKEKTNLGYLRKRYGVTAKLTSVYLCSRKYKIRGIMDEVLFLNDGTAAPLDYKFAKYDGHIFQTYKFQSALYGLMISDFFNRPVNRGYLCFCRGGNKIVEINFNEKLFETAKDIIKKIFFIIQNEEFPEKTGNSKRCIDCCYRKICIH